MAVYPRWRGEHLSSLFHARTKNGLSPLARGTLSVFMCVVALHRFIPAGAGNTLNGYNCL